MNKPIYFKEEPETFGRIVFRDSEIVVQYLCYYGKDSRYTTKYIFPSDDVPKTYKKYLGSILTRKER